MKAIKRFIKRHNPYFKLKAAKNEIRLLVEENQWLQERLKNLEKSQQPTP